MRAKNLNQFLKFSLFLVITGFGLVSCGPSTATPTASASPKPEEISASPSPVVAAAASVVFLEGSASLIRNNQAIPLSIGDTVQGADTVKTGAASRVELDFPAVGQIIVKANSSFRLDAISSDGHRMLGSDLNGQIVARAKKLATGDSLIIKTPAVACGVRGTIFLVSVTAGGISDFAVREGVVAVFPNSAIDKGWLKTSTGADNALDVEKFPQIGANQRISVKPGDKRLAALEKALDSSPAGTPSPALNDALPWLKAEPETLTAEDKTLLEIPAPQVSGAGVSAVDLFAGDPDNSLIMSPTNQPKVKLDVSNPWNFDAPYSAVPVDAAPISAYQIGKDIDFLNFYGAQGKLSQKGKSPQIELVKSDGQIQNAGMIMRQTYGMEKGMLYKLSFTAWAEKPARIVADLHEDNRDLNGDGLTWTAYKPWVFLELSGTPTRYATYFTNLTGNDNAARLTFQLGETSAIYYVQDVSLEKIGKAPVAGAGNQIPNGDFRYGFLDWRPSDWKTDQARFSCEQGIFTFTPVKKPAAFWDIQLIAPFVSLVKGKTYEIDFDAQCDAPVKVGMGIQEDNRDLNLDGDKFSQEIKYLNLPLDKSWRHFKARVKALQSDDKANLVFNIGAANKPLRLAKLEFKALQ